MGESGQGVRTFSRVMLLSLSYEESEVYLSLLYALGPLLEKELWQLK